MDKLRNGLRLTKICSPSYTTKVVPLKVKPSRTGEFSPARLAFRRERRHPLIPCLPAEGGEVEQGRKQLQDRAEEQVRRNSKRGKHVKKPIPTSTSWPTSTSTPALTTTPLMLDMESLINAVAHRPGSTMTAPSRPKDHHHQQLISLN